MRNLLPALGVLAVTNIAFADPADLAKDADHGAFVAYYLVKKKADLTYEAFRAYETEVHAPLALDLPGLLDYRLIFFPPIEGEAQTYDAMARLTFESEDAHDAALSGEEGQRALADLPNVVDASAMFRLSAAGGDAYAGNF